MITARLTAQGLSGTPARSVDAVIERLLAVQAQDPRGARLAVRSRSKGLLATDVDDALNSGRAIITWLNRGTLHLVLAADYWWLHPLTTPQLAVANRRRLEQEGVSPAQADHGVAVVTEAIATGGPQTRLDLRRALDAARVPTAGQALVHVLFAASLHGDTIRGPLRGSEPTFVSARDWLGAPPEPLEREVALARLGRRYLVGHGPADARDLAKWAGITLGHARLAFAQNRDLLTEAEGRFDLRRRARAARLPGPRLLGPFDPLLLGWASRAKLVGFHTVITTNGLFRACALVDGRVVATWGLANGRLTVTLLEPVPSATVDALRRDGLDVLRFLGLAKDSEIRFENAG